MKKILIDVMGCDNPDAVIDGLALAINATKDIILIACGDKTRIENRLKDKEFDSSRLEIIDAPDEITNNDKSVNAVLMKKRSSLIVSLNTLKNTKDIPVMITAGSTGALIAGSILILGRNKPDDRATLVTHFPTDKGGMAVLADCGANVDCGPEHLLKFAQYANDYVKKVFFGVFENEKFINECIDKCLLKWKKERVSIVSRAVLQLACYEMAFVEDIPTKVSINEAIELSKKFDSDDSYTFVNGILGAFVRNEYTLTPTAE